MSKRRLIEDWLPIAALSEECVRERRSMTALPATYYLHVWFARRPLVASRAAVLGSLLGADANRSQFLHDLGIHGDPVAAKVRIASATAKGQRLGADAYGYTRAFQHLPPPSQRMRTILDPTAGGGSIPFEAVRLGCDVVGNDLNPVASLVLKTTVELPLQYGSALLERVKTLGVEFVKRVRGQIAGLYPDEPDGWICDGYLWARTVTCPYLRRHSAFVAELEALRFWTRCTTGATKRARAVRNGRARDRSLAWHRQGRRRSMPFPRMSANH